jgi:hypothetical protein
VGVLCEAPAAGAAHDLSEAPAAGAAADVWTRRGAMAGAAADVWTRRGAILWMPAGALGRAGVEAGDAPAGGARSWSMCSPQAAARAALAGGPQAPPADERATLAQPEAAREEAVVDALAEALWQRLEQRRGGA